MGKESISSDSSSPTKHCCWLQDHLERPESCLECTAGSSCEDWWCRPFLYTKLVQRCYPSYGGWSILGRMSEARWQAQHSTRYEDTYQVKVRPDSTIKALSRSFPGWLLPPGRNFYLILRYWHCFIGFERTLCAQKNGFKNREKWGKEFDEARKNPFSTAQSIGRWISDHNPQQYAYELASMLEPSSLGLPVPKYQSSTRIYLQAVDNGRGNANVRKGATDQWPRRVGLTQYLRGHRNLSADAFNEDAA